MSLLAALIGQVRPFDDDALAALANRGLLRRARKDLETAQPAIAEDTPAQVIVAIAGQQVRFDARGPAQATCSCPTAGTCQHILAAIVWLQSQQAGAEATAAQVSETPGVERPVADDSRAKAHAALLAMSADILGKHAGKPGYRWAWQFLQDLDVESELRIGGERYVTIGFARPRVGFRYMGGPIENLIADNELPRIEKYRVAAVLAYQQAHGALILAPEAQAPANATLDLGKDHALAEAGPVAQRASRQRLRAAIARLLEECLELGLSHLSQGIQERYATIAVWAQGAEYFRLAPLLRRVADHVELLLDRAGGADEHRLLEEMSLAAALVEALEDADRRGAAPLALVGRARQRYESSGPLELFGLGAWPWRAASGYVGLTMLFWSPQERCFLSCTDARPEGQAGFDPLKRYTLAGPWSGLGAPAQATGKQVLLDQASTNAQGRLSASERVQALLKPLDAISLRESLVVHASWPELRQSRQTMQRSLLAEPEPMRDWVVLRPARFGPANFDAARQVLAWSLFDDQDERLLAEVAYSDYGEHAIARIEAEGAGISRGTLLIARLRGQGAGLVAEPLSLIHADASTDRAVDALYFDAAADRGLWSQTFDRLRSAIGASRASPHCAGPQHGPPRLLHDLQVWLRRQAERGINPLSELQASAEFDAQVRKLRDGGFSAFGMRDSSQSMTALVLRAHYLVMQYLKLMGIGVDADAEG